MVFIKGSYIYDVRKKVENSDVIDFVFANAENIYNSRKYNKTDRKANRRYPSRISWYTIMPPVSPLQK